MPEGGDSDLEREWDECMEGMITLRDAVQHDLIVLSMILRRYASFPRDLQVSTSELRRIIGSPLPDVICVQEGLEGMDMLTEVGYKRIASSVLRSQALRDAVYGSAVELNSVSGSSHGRLLVNELYIRMQGSSWEAIDSGAAQISSDLTLSMGGPDDMSQGAGLPVGAWPLATRSAVWTKLRHRDRPAGPFAYVLNTQFSGGDLEDRFFAGPLAEERKLQADRLLELFNSRLGVGGQDLGILAGHFYSSEPEDAAGLPLRVPPDASGTGLSPDQMCRQYQAYLDGPFNVLKQHGWRMAYNQAQVGPTSPEKQLVDYMATNRATPVKAQVLMASGSAAAVPLSDHNFVKARFQVRLAEAKSPANAVVSRAVRERRMHVMAQGVNSAPWLGGGALAAAMSAGANRRLRLQCEHEDLQRELHAERQAAEELQAELSGEMRELRDQCQEQGQTVGLLTQRLADARNAITAELQSAATERAALGGELMSEESQRRKLEAALHNEESEAACRVQAAEQQLLSMVAVRDSLQAQLRGSLKVQDELLAHISAEREGRAELEVAGERELVAWQARNGSSKATSAPCSLPERLAGVRAARKKLRRYLNAEAEMCRREIDAMRERSLEASQEIRLCRDNETRNSTALEASECEMPHLAEEAREAVDAANASSLELEGVNRRVRELQDQLDAIKEAFVECREDHFAVQLKEEREYLTREVNQEMQRQQTLMVELKARKSRSFLHCLFPQRASQAPPPAPPLKSAPPPRTGEPVMGPRPVAPPVNTAPLPDARLPTQRPPLPADDGLSSNSGSRMGPPQQQQLPPQGLSGHPRAGGDEGGGVCVEESSDDGSQPPVPKPKASLPQSHSPDNADEYLFRGQRQDPSSGAGGHSSVAAGNTVGRGHAEPEVIESDEV
eukprot:TRINITY_DN30910_c0_g1_i1.p1 TRINITY_DN30910_c0_g1~~TRINITY_DN30910_c0_g1_i1.p1  ORF type:complete len:961 (+),score=186.22 TRINITY_DN30910_c0_g1_i1:180-2885(+)